MPAILRKHCNPSIENIYAWVTFINFLFLFGIALNGLLQSVESACTKTAVLHRRNFPTVFLRVPLFSLMYFHVQQLYFFWGTFPPTFLARFFPLYCWFPTLPSFLLKILLLCIIFWLLGNSWYWSFRLRLSKLWQYADVATHGFFFLLGGPRFILSFVFIDIGRLDTLKSVRTAFQFSLFFSDVVNWIAS